MVNGGRAFTGVASTLHMVRPTLVNILLTPSISWLTVGIAVSLRRILWTFALFDSRMDLHAVRNAVRTPSSRFWWTACTRTCDSFCARDPRWTAMCRRRSQSVRTSKTGTASTRSCVKSEYAQPLVIVSGTLFDTNIAYRRYTGTVPGG